MEGWSPSVTETPKKMVLLCLGCKRKSGSHRLGRERFMILRGFIFLFLTFLLKDIGSQSWSLREVTQLKGENEKGKSEGANAKAKKDGSTG